MSSFDLSKPISDFRGKFFREGGAPWKDGDPEAERMTIARVISVALNNGVSDEKDFAAAMKRFDLMKKIETAEGCVVDLKAADVTLIQKLLPLVWTPLFVGRVNEVIEPTKEG